MSLPSAPVPGFGPGPRLPNGSDLQKLANLVGSVQSGITAKAGGGASGATEINAALAEVTTVATANDSVLLPLAYPGLQILLQNADSADSMQVFASGTDTINGIDGQATGVAHAAGKSAIYWCPVAGKWYRLLSA